MEGTSNNKEFRRYLRQIQKNTGNRPVKKFDFRSSFGGAYPKSQLINKKQHGPTYENMVAIHTDEYIIAHPIKIRTFNREKEYFKRMFLGQIIHPDELGAISFLKDKCKNCNVLRWKHKDGKCPDNKNLFRISDDIITQLVLETLALEGIDIPKKYRKEL